MKRGFTLIELLVVVAIIGVMLGSAILSVGSGSASAHMKSATRRVLQLSRHARTMALLRQQPAVITFEEVYDGATLVGGKVTIESKAEHKAESAAQAPVTIDGEPPEEEEPQPLGMGKEQKPVSESPELAEGSDTSREQEIMEKVVDDPRDSAPDKTDATDWDPDSPRSFQGIHLKAELLDDEGLAFGERKASISVFSNVDFLRSQSRSKTTEAEDEAKKDEDSKTVSVHAAEPISIVYETNGRCTPYRVKIWKDGADEDSGLTVTVDRFGKTKVEGDAE